jgi:predicted secreted protein
MPILFRLSTYDCCTWLAWSTVLLAAPTIISPADATRIGTMYRMERRAHGAPDGVTQAQIRKIVIDLAEQRGWEAHVRTAGVVETDASWRSGKHRFTVATVFDDETFAVRYVSSYNLGYSDTHCRAPYPAEVASRMERTRERMGRNRAERCNTEVIHPSYNNFVQQFEADIVEAVSQLKPEPAAAQSVAVADTVAEENRRLEALQASGIVTLEERMAHQKLLAGSDVDEAGEP